MSGYIGTQPVPQATQTRDSFTATSGQTSFATGGYTPNFLDVYLNGVKLASADYTATNGSDVVLASGASTGDILEVVAFTTFNSASSSIDDNGNATAITIDSNENVLIGKASADGTGSTGHDIRATGLAYHTVDGGDVKVLNRLNSDGGILSLRKDGTAVGSIGVTASDILYLANPDGTGCGLNFDGDSPKINPTNGSGAGTNGIVDLGWSGGRFKDAYLSGGVYLGGTGSANKLDDVESGTFQPSIAVGYNYGSGYYNKIGDLVTVSLDFQVASNSNTSTFTLTGMPFTTVGWGSLAIGYNTTGYSNMYFFWGGTTIYAYDQNGSAYNFNNFSNKAIRLSGTVRVT